MATVVRRVASFLGSSVSYAFDDQTLELLEVRVRNAERNGYRARVTVRQKDAPRTVVHEQGDIRDDADTDVDLRTKGAAMKAGEKPSDTGKLVPNFSIRVEWVHTSRQTERER
jgi:hypothetical protein